MATTLSQAIQEYLDACAANGLKRLTVKWYAGKLASFSESLETLRFGDVLIGEVDLADMRQYVRTLYERRQRYRGGANHKRPIDGGLALESVRGHLRALRAFWGWCEKEGLLYGDNPMKGIKMPRQARPVPKAIAAADIRRLLEACDDSPSGRRAAAIIAFLADTGCRAQGLLTLKPEGLYTVVHRAEVFEKGDRGRVVAYSDYTAAALERWLEVQPAGARTVFCALGTNTRGEPLTLSGLHGILRAVARQAGVTGKINPHAFRHSFARRWLLAGGDISSLAQVMGHSTTSITVDVYGVFLHDEALVRQENLGLMARLFEGKDGK